MALTEEQRRRMEENRKKALEIRKRRKEEEERKAAGGNNNRGGLEEDGNELGGFVPRPKSEDCATADVAGKTGVKVGLAVQKNRIEGKGIPNEARGKVERNEDDVDSDDESLEEFEIDAPGHISQTEAKSAYCVPNGTLAVCSFIEKDNPRQKGWSKMKLYKRSEVRKRGRKRFGGKEGLRREREQRARKRLEKDLEEAEDVFR